MVEKTNYIPGFLYLLFGSTIVGSELVHPSVIANVFILLALIYLIETYREENVLPMLSKASFFISLATFFYTNYAFFILHSLSVYWYYVHLIGASGQLAYWDYLHRW